MLSNTNAELHHCFCAYLSLVLDNDVRYTSSPYHRLRSSSWVCISVRAWFSGPQYSALITIFLLYRNLCSKVLSRALTSTFFLVVVSSVNPSFRTNHHLQHLLVLQSEISPLVRRSRYILSNNE